MKIAIIPDIHGRKFWRELDISSVDKVIFLGDYLDPYPQDKSEKLEEDTVISLEDVIYLKKKNPDKCVLLIGNHDAHYIWNNFEGGSRYNHLRAKEYKELFNDNLDLFKLVHIENNSIFSHAGITKLWAEKVWDNLEFPENEIYSIKDVAEILSDTPLSNFNDKYIDLLNYISYHRGGLDKTGSCVWADASEHLDKKYDTYQIFGHTWISKPVITDSWACLDCQKIFIMENNKIDVYQSNLQQSE